MHVSVDLDVVDPEFAPGVGDPVLGGLSYREAHLALELVAEAGVLDCLELVEVNPIRDHENTTATLAVGLARARSGSESSRGWRNVARRRGAMVVPRARTQGASRLVSLGATETRPGRAARPGGTTTFRQSLLNEDVRRAAEDERAQHVRLGDPGQRGVLEIDLDVRPGFEPE